MSEHMSLRDHLVEVAERGHQPVFQPSADPILMEFARIFADSEWFAFDVNKMPSETRLGWSGYSLYTETVKAAGDAPQEFDVLWASGVPGQDPRTAFKVSPGTLPWGALVPEVMPLDERTDALVLIVSSKFVHLSGSYEDSSPLVRGAIDIGGEEFAYVVLDPVRAVEV